MSPVRQRRSFALAMVALSLLAGSARAAGPIDLREYFPAQEGNSWSYQFRTFQPDGQVNYALKTYTVAGTEELKNGVKATRLVDQRGWYYIFTVDEKQYLHHGESEDKGLVTNDPPFTFFDTSYAFGKVYRSAHAISDGTAHGSEVVVDGFESVNVPAGEFKDCLKATFKYIRAGGGTFTSITWLAKGVGPVKKQFAIYSEKAGQTLAFDRELLSARIAGKPVSGPEVTDLASYFPYFQGDEWTYDWTYTLPDGTERAEERTRSFAGTEFFNRTAAFKLLDNKGSYQYYTWDPKNGIEMHASFESRPGGQLITYQPAVTIAKNGMIVGRPYQWSDVAPDQPADAGRNKRLQRWTSTIDGTRFLETPLGRFEVIRARLQWETAKSRATQIYYLGKNVGIVGMDYEAIDSQTGKRTIALQARLKKAKLQGDAVASLGDLDAHMKRASTAKAALADDPEARRIFRAASLNRYVWDGGFPGIKGELEIVDHGKPPVRATVSVDKNLVVDFECDACGSELRAMARAQISQYVTHRASESFEEKYGPGKAFFSLLKKRDDGTYEIKVDGDTAMGSWYLIDGKQVRKLTRVLGGPVEFLINNEKGIATEDGRSIASYYPVDFYMKQGDKKIPLGTVTYDDQFEKVGKWWLPKHRILKGKMPQPDGTSLDVDLELRFTSVAYLGGGDARPVATRDNR